MELDDLPGFFFAAKFFQILNLFPKPFRYKKIAVKKLTNYLRARFFNQSEESVQDNSDDAQNDNGHQYPGKLKGLAGIDDQVAKPFSGTDKFAYDNTNQTQTNINFHNTEQ